MIQVFRNREEAGQMIASELDRYSGKNPLILAIPRGALRMGQVIAERLGGELDVALVRKIGAPGNSEFAIGAVSEFGIYRSEAIAQYGIPESYIQETARQERQILSQRRQQYSHVRPPIDPRDRIVILVDDGIATGSTMLAAAQAVHARRPERLIVASPVASLSAVELLKRALPEIDELLILEIPEIFYSVSQFYEEFSQVEDNEAIQILADSQKMKPAA